MTDVQFMVDEDVILSRPSTPMREAKLVRLERRALFEECRDAGVNAREIMLFGTRIRRALRG